MDKKSENIECAMLSVLLKQTQLLLEVIERQRQRNEKKQIPCPKDKANIRI